MDYFYARVSTKDQNLDRQLERAKQLNIPEERVFADKQSGKNTKRPEWIKLNRLLKSEDNLYVSSMSRLSRSLKDLLQISSDLTERNISLHLLKESINTKNATGRMMLGVVGSVFEFEREIIVENVKEGVTVSLNKRKKLNIVNDAGNLWGGQQVKDLTSEQKRVINLWISKSITTQDARDILKCSRTQLYKLKAKL